MEKNESLKNRAWHVIIHIQNMRNAGLTDEEANDSEYAANFIKDNWEGSAKGRKAYVAVCMSEKGRYHLHALLYGPPTTLNTVKKLMYDSHIELVKNKKKLMSYIKKKGKYAEKGEEILYTAGEEDIVDSQGHRSDLDYIQEMLDKGMNPNEVMAENIRFRRYEKIICAEYNDRLRENIPYKREMCRTWHYGDYDAGIDTVNENLIKEKGLKNVMYLQYTDNGCLDKYNKMGNPPILVVNVASHTKISDLLPLLNEYTNTTVRCRYEDVIPYWNEVHLLSENPIEDYFISSDDKGLEKRLLSKLDFIEYHYIKDGKPTSYKIPATSYKNSETLIKSIHNGTIDDEMRCDIEDDHA